MERAPVPPHERTWRHPSELAAGARAELVAEPATASAKLLTISVGAFTLLALAVVVVTFTPDRVDDRVADRATPSTVASALLNAGRAFVAELTSADDHRRSVTTVAATPSAAGTTRTATTVVLELHGTGTLVALPVALTAPAQDDTVTVLTDPPVHSSYGRVRATLVVVAAPDGTAVLDERGRLIGVWTTDGLRSRLITADDLASRQRGETSVAATTVVPD